MAWVKLDVGYLRSPKLVDLPPKVVLLHLGSILWTAEHLTDGWVPDHALILLSSQADLAPNRRRWAARLLTQRSLWDQGVGGWQVHDFVEWNRTSTREYVEQQRADWRERQARARKAGS